MDVLLTIIILFGIALIGWSALVAASDADDHMGYP